MSLESDVLKNGNPGDIASELAFYSLDTQTNQFTLRSLPKVTVKTRKIDVTIQIPIVGMEKMPSNQYVLMLRSSSRSEKNEQTQELNVLIYQQQEKKWSSFSHSSTKFFDAVGKTSLKENLVCVPVIFSDKNSVVLEMTWKLGSLCFDTVNKKWNQHILHTLEHGAIRAKGLFKGPSSLIFAVMKRVCDGGVGGLRLFFFDDTTGEKKEFLLSTRSVPMNVVLDEHGEDLLLFWRSGNFTSCADGGERLKSHWVRFGRCSP